MPAGSPWGSAPKWAAPDPEPPDVEPGIHHHHRRQPAQASGGSDQVRPGVAAADGRTARFADGTSLDVEMVIWATGYRSDYSWIYIPGLAPRRAGSPSARRHRGTWPVLPRPVVAAHPRLGPARLRQTTMPTTSPIASPPASHFTRRGCRHPATIQLTRFRERGTAARRNTRQLGLARTGPIAARLWLCLFGARTGAGGRNCRRHSASRPAQSSCPW